MTLLHSADTIVFDSQWWEMRAKGDPAAHSAAFGQPEAGAPAALKWTTPLTVKSIRDGDSVARLYTVTIADYNSTTPLPQHPSSSSSELPLLQPAFEMKCGDFRRVQRGGVESEGRTLHRQGGFRVTKEKDERRKENRNVRRS